VTGGVVGPDGAAEEKQKPEGEKKKKEKKKMTVRDFIRPVRHPKEEVVYHSPSGALFGAAERAAALLDGDAEQCSAETMEKAQKILAPMGMEVIDFTFKKVRFLILREVKETFRGSGVYVLCCGRTEPLVIQAPHGYFDLNTATLGYRAFRRSKARWFMINSLQRYESRDMETRTEEFHPTDPAHNANSLYQAVTLGILKTSPHLLFVQLHGFDASWRNTDAVFSDGRTEPQIWSEKLAKAWKQNKWRMLVFGRQFKGLGAPTNVQGRAINLAGGRFLHIEMSLEMRRWMVRSAENRKRFVRALIRVARDYEGNED
jgi:hypothetical protein